MNVMIAGLLLVFALSGCGSVKGNVGRMSTYAPPYLEKDWIRNGEPIEFENELWYPSDEVETLLDSEMYLLVEYKGVQIFAEKTDVRPYNRLYTKFNNNSFRYFEKKEK